MRNMSFAMTTEQIMAGTKTVTRRFGWKSLKPGDLVRPVRKSMGMKKGEKIEPLRGPLRIVSVRREPLDAITSLDCIREGFPLSKPTDFINMLVGHYRCDPHEECTRIEFEYTDNGDHS